MKKLVFLWILGMLMACNNTATLENKADSLAKHVDSTSERLWDSGKKDVKELKEKIKGEFKKDSVIK